MQIETGQQATDFSLYDSDKQKITLSEYKGQPVLILFFPLAFTSTCTKELCSVRDDLQWYNDLQVKVLAISVDSLHTLKKYKEEQNLNFTLLSDFNKEISRAYDSLYENFGYGMKGVTKRSAFVIDREGIVQYAEVLEDASRVPDFQAIRDTLNRLPKS
jgi:glutaredoxin-dependent peroxiredoxin